MQSRCAKPCKANTLNIAEHCETVGRHPFTVSPRRIQGPATTIDKTLFSYPRASSTFNPSPPVVINFNHSLTGQSRVKCVARAPRQDRRAGEPAVADPVAAAPVPLELRHCAQCLAACLRTLGQMALNHHAAAPPKPHVQGAQVLRLYGKLRQRAPHRLRDHGALAYRLPQRKACQKVPRAPRNGARARRAPKDAAHLGARQQRKKTTSPSTSVESFVEPAQLQSDEGALVRQTTEEVNAHLPVARQARGADGGPAVFALRRLRSLCRLHLAPLCRRWPWTRRVKQVIFGEFFREMGIILY